MKGILVYVSKDISNLLLWARGTLTKLLTIIKVRHILKRT
jgi:hypothetical protein